MNYVFFGTPRFATLVLKELLSAGFPPVALVCNPDRPVGRKKIITPPETKKVVSDWCLATSKEIEILQPEKLDQQFLDKLKELNADFYVVAAYAKILKKDLLSIPRLGAIGVHPSLLPKYRGASPIQSAILAGDEITGVDLFMLTPAIDDGDILASENLKIKNQNYSELERELAVLGGKLLVKILPDFLAGKVERQSQDDSNATFTRKFETKDGFVPYEYLLRAQSGEDKEKAIEIERKIRALGAEPGVYTIVESKPFDSIRQGSPQAAQGKRVKLLKASVAEGKLKIEQIQKEGGKPVSASTAF